MRLRSILQKYTSNLSTGTESNAPSTTSTEGDTDGRNTTSIVHIATNTCETLIDNERSLQFARLSLLSEKKDLELKIDGGGLQLNEVKALKHRIKSLDKCIYQYDSRIQTTKEEYEAIRDDLASELNRYEVETTSLIPKRVLARQLKHFTGGKERTEVGMVTKSLAKSSSAPLSSPLSKSAVKSSNGNVDRQGIISKMSSPSLKKSFAAASPVFDARNLPSNNNNNVEESVKKGRKKLPSINL